MAYIEALYEKHQVLFWILGIIAGRYIPEWRSIREFLKFLPRGFKSAIRHAREARLAELELFADNRALLIESVAKQACSILAIILGSAPLILVVLRHRQPKIDPLLARLDGLYVLVFMGIYGLAYAAALSAFTLWLNRNPRHKAARLREKLAQSTRP